MSWIKDNKFVVALGGGSLVGAMLIFLVGSKESSRYDQAKEEFDTTAAEATSFESLALYPSSENCDGKRKALVEYRQATDSLQGAFKDFRPKEMKNVSPQVFTDQLKSVNTEVRKALADAGTQVPDAFFCGFENYQTKLAPGNATGILNYQLGGIKTLMLALAKAGPTELKNLHRPTLAEEDGQPPSLLDAEVARPLPLEITFVGPEKSLRAFLSTIIKQPSCYFVIRSLAVANSKKDPPRSSDAKFEKPATRAASADTTSGGFTLPGDEHKPEIKKLVATAATQDTSRILAQVLGDEEVQVFLRLDLMQFLPAKKLP